MKILFLSISEFESINQHGIYTDLMREFMRHGHEVYIVCARERRNGQPTELIEENGAKLLHIKIGNITKTNMIEKGISTILIGYQYKAAIKKYFSHIMFDLVLYPTPPITICGVVEYVKRRDRARSYLLLKDIFPQNAVDMGILHKNGLTGVLYQYFRYKEKKLYRLSDTIGCMSEANVKYVLKHNPEISSSKVEICPNAIEPIKVSLSKNERVSIRDKYGLPQDKIIFVYGGNLGKPQGIGFMLQCLHSQRRSDRAFFLIIGNGTEYSRVQHYIERQKPQNIKLFQWLPRDEYERVVAACDVGMIFLDHRFTIPNFPSRLLGYMQAELPILAVTDPNTDIGQVIVDGNFGWWCESNNILAFKKLIFTICNKDIDSQIKKRVFSELKDLYSSQKAYHTIINRLKTYGEIV